MSRVQGQGEGLALTAGSLSDNHYLSGLAASLSPYPQMSWHDKIPVPAAGLGSCPCTP